MLQSKLQPCLPMTHGKKGLFGLDCRSQPLLFEHVPNHLDTYIKVTRFLELSWSISSSRGDFSSKEVSVLSCELGWASTTPPGEGMTDVGVEPLDCKEADMHLGSHLLTGIAFLEQSSDCLLSGGRHDCWGVIVTQGSLYILGRSGHMMFKV